MTTSSKQDKLSAIHRDIHRSTLQQARRMALAGDRPAAFRMLELAKTARFYFARFRELGE